MAILCQQWLAISRPEVLLEALASFNLLRLVADGAGQKEIREQRGPGKPGCGKA